MIRFRTLSSFRNFKNISAQRDTESPATTPAEFRPLNSVYRMTAGVTVMKAPVSHQRRQGLEGQRRTDVCLIDWSHRTLVYAAGDHRHAGCQIVRVWFAYSRHMYATTDSCGFDAPESITIDTQEADKRAAHLAATHAIHCGWPH